MSMQAYTLLFYRSLDDVFSRHCDYPSDEDAIRDARAMLLRLRDTEPGTVTSIAVGRGVDEGEQEAELITWLGSWEWDGHPRWEPEK